MSFTEAFFSLYLNFLLLLVLGSGSCCFSLRIFLKMFCSLFLLLLITGGSFAFAISHLPLISQFLRILLLLLPPHLLFFTVYKFSFTLFVLLDTFGLVSLYLLFLLLFLNLLLRLLFLRFFFHFFSIFLL